MGGGDGYYVPPPKGPSQADVWVKNSQLSGDHVVAGSIDTAMIVSVLKILSKLNSRDFHLRI